MLTNPSIVESSNPPRIMNFLPEFGGSTKFEDTPGGGGETGIIASTEAGRFSKSDILASTVALG